MADFMFQALENKDSIRLFRIVNDNERDSIVCELFHVRLSEQPDFVALSYAWDEPVTNTVLADRSNDDRWCYVAIRYGNKSSYPGFGRLEVGLNTAAALRMLRDQNPRDKSFWADLICIDQGNLNEKGLQVAMMGDIYCRATSVLVWLGEETSKDGEAFQLLRNLPYEYVDLAERNRSLELASIANSDAAQIFYSKHGLQKYEFFSYSEAYRALRAMYERSWFSRIWCVQEACLASLWNETEPELVCGSLRLDWRYFFAFQYLMFAGGMTGRITDDLRYLVNADRMRETREAILDIRNETGGISDRPVTSVYPSLQLCNLLSRFSSFDAALEVDKIFSMLGLANDVRNETGELLFVPDYTKTLSEVNRELTAFLIWREDNLHVLDFVSIHAGHLANDYGHLLAGWVPHWTREMYVARRLGRSRSRLGGSYQPDRDSPPSERPLIADSCLLVEAFLVDQVSAILEPISKYTSYNDENWYNAIARNWKLVYYQDPKYYSAADLQQAFWRVIASDDAGVQDHWREHFAFVGDPSCTREISLKALPDTCPVNLEHIQFCHVIQLQNDQRRMFFVNSGRLGLGPNNMQQGDQVAILQGARTPFVLRKLVARSRNDVVADMPLYGVVGEAYLDGVMQGELFSKPHVGWHRVALSNETIAHTDSE